MVTGSSCRILAGIPDSYRTVPHKSYLTGAFSSSIGRLPNQPAALAANATARP